MGALDVIPFPGWPGHVGRRAFVEAWVAGGSPPLNGPDATTRTEERQTYLYNGYQARLPGFKDASHPKTGRRPHMKGGAGDCHDFSVAKMERAGLVRPFSHEPWHWEHLDAASWPVITDAALAAARVSLAGIEATPIINYGRNRRRKDRQMYVKGKTHPEVYALYTDAVGVPRLRLCGKNETAYANAGGLVVVGDDDTLRGLGTEGRYRAPDTAVRDAVWNEPIARGEGRVPALQDLANTGTGVASLRALIESGDAPKA